jgi:hypothetical protein
VSNYRPILLTPFSKICEEVILSDKKILVSEQFGFKVNSCAIMTAYKLLDEILNALNNTV